MRLFVGIELDEAARTHVAEVSRRLRARLGDSLPARWVAAENLHVTVRFVGHVPDAACPALIQALARPVGVPAFEVRLQGLGRFPATRAPRVLWMGLSKGQRPLTALHDEFNKRVAPFGFESDGRSFNAHVTLARIKDAPSGTALTVDDTLRSIVSGSAAFRVSRATIFESRPGKRGSDYFPVGYSRLTTPAR